MEILDQLIIRLLFIIIITAILWGYKGIHLIFYPHARSQLFKRFNTAHNEAATIHLAGRLLGFGILFSYFDLQVEQLLLNILDLIVLGTIASVLYILLLYLLESITLSSFSYKQEISQKKNNSYALISFTNSVSWAIIVRAVMDTAQTSLIIMVTILPLALIIISIISRLFSTYSDLSWKKLIVIKNMAIAIYYLGYMLGSSFILYFTFRKPFQNIFLYLLGLLIDLSLIAIIFPLFNRIIRFIYSLVITSHDEPPLSFGVTSMAVFLVTSILTALIVARTSFAIYIFN